MRSSQHGSWCALAPSRGSLESARSEAMECQGSVTVPRDGTSSMGLLELCPRERPQGQRHGCGDHGSARSDSQKSAWGLIRKTSPLGTQCSHGMAYQGAGGCNLCSCRFFFRIYWLNSCLQHGIAVPPHGDTAGIHGLLVTGH